MNEGATTGRAGLGERAPAAVVALLAAALAACGGSRPSEPAEPAPRLDFPAKQRFPARLDLRPTAEGGRATPVAGAWRGRFVFDGGDDTRCGVDSGDVPELEPGSSHPVHLVCAGAVSLPDDGRRGFRVLEDGREVGSGLVLP